MYSLIGKMIAKPDRRDAPVAILLEGADAAGPGDANAIWITEVWITQAQHDASLQLPAVQAAIARARPLIEGFGDQFVTAPVGGVGFS